MRGWGGGYIGRMGVLNEQYFAIFKQCAQCNITHDQGYESTPS